MVKEGYKEVRIGPKKVELPINWETSKIKELLKIKSGYAFKSNDYVEDGVFMVRVTNINDNGEIKKENGETKYLPEEYLEKYKKYQLEDNDILLVMVGASTGKIGKVKSDVLPAILNQNMWNLKPKDDSLDKPYFYYSISKEINRFLSMKIGSARSYIKKGDFKKFEIPLPPLSEQKKIASILLSVDKSIKKTNEVIEKTKELKKGLMQELFTKGIGHIEFKDSQFGDIPKNWEINVMSYAANINPRYKIPEKDEYLFLEMDSVNENSPEVDGYEKREKSRCTNVKFKKGDVLFARITPSTENGKTALIENLEEEIAFGSTELIVLSPKKDLITSDYIYYLLKWSKVRNLAISMMEGSTGRQRVPREVFDSAIKIPLPPLEEQKKIASILSSVDAKIEKEEEYKARLERLKKGLMQKLLTGEIRVNTEMEV